MQSEIECLIDLLKRCVEANNSDKYRFGNLVRLPAQGSLIVSSHETGIQRCSRQR